MKIGLKYCGGCNPNYERSDIVKRARVDYPHAVFESHRAEARYDLVLVVCGCLEECSTFSCENSIHGMIHIRSLEEYDRLTAFMKLHQQLSESATSPISNPNG